MPTAPPIAPIGTVRQAVDLNAAPKARFRESNDNISRHRALVESREFERALDFAVLQYSRDVANEIKDTNTALAGGYKLTGVQEFIKVLRTLSELPPIKFTAPNDNLGS